MVGQQRTGWDACEPDVAVAHPLARDAAAVASVVVVADGGVWCDGTASYLAREGFLVVVDPTGDITFDARAGYADAVILDMALSARSATDVCKAWTEHSRASVLAVVAARDESTILSAYAAGADRVALAGCSTRILLAHLRALLRRAPVRRRPPPESSSEPLAILLDAEGRVAMVKSTRVPLTKQEFDFLQLLVDRAGRVVERRELSMFTAATNERAVDFFIRRLRAKLESVEGQRRITTVRGVGFRFELGANRGTEVQL